MSYGPDLRDLYRQAAGHVDRIPKGTTPADLPVEQPTTYQVHPRMPDATVTAAQALGLQVQRTPTRGPEDYDATFVAIARARAEALIVLGDLTFGFIVPVSTRWRRAIGDRQCTRHANKWSPVA